METKPPKPANKTYPTITPYIMVKGAVKLMDFLRQAFGAEEARSDMRPEDGTVMHAEMRIGNSMVMISDAKEEYPATTVMIFVFMDDCDTYYKRALEAGAKSIREPADEKYGDRMSGVADFAGNQWWIASAIKS